MGGERGSWSLTVIYRGGYTYVSNCCVDQLCPGSGQEKLSHVFDIPSTFKQNKAVVSGLTSPLPLQEKELALLQVLQLHSCLHSHLEK